MEHSSNLREKSSTAAASFSARIRASRRQRSFRPFVLSSPKRLGPPLEEAAAMLRSCGACGVVVEERRFKADGGNANKKLQQRRQFVSDSHLDIRVELTAP